MPQEHHSITSTCTAPSKYAMGAICWGILAYMMRGALHGIRDEKKPAKGIRALISEYITNYQLIINYISKAYHNTRHVYTTLYTYWTACTCTVVGHLKKDTLEMRTPLQTEFYAILSWLKGASSFHGQFKLHVNLSMYHSIPGKCPLPAKRPWTKFQWVNVCSFHINNMQFICMAASCTCTCTTERKCHGIL